MLIPPLDVTVIPVSCAEQGRWVYESEIYSEEQPPLPI
jgi:hypothetical protein